MDEFKKDKEKIYFTGMVVSILFSVVLSLFMWVVITVAGDFALKVNEQHIRSFARWEDVAYAAKKI